MATAKDSTETNDLATAVAGKLSLQENTLMEQIRIQGDHIRKLKAEKAPQDQVSILFITSLISQICFDTVFLSL